MKYMVHTCNLAWKQGGVPKDCKGAIIVPLYKDKGRRDECHKA